MMRKIGFYDCVRFGADNEMLHRAKRVLGPAFRDFEVFSMLCMDLPGGLTNHPDHGLKTTDGTSLVRRRYNSSWRKWHRENAPHDLILPFPSDKRQFSIPKELQVDIKDIDQALQS